MKHCSNCNTQLPDNAMFCGACGNSLAQSPVQPQPQAYVEEQYFVPQKKKSKLLPILLTSGIALVLVIAVVVTGVLTNWFGFVSPLRGLGKAFTKTLGADSLSVNLNVELLDEDVDIDVKCVADEKRENLAVKATVANYITFLMTDDTSYLLYKLGSYSSGEIDHMYGFNDEFFDLRDDRGDFDLDDLDDIVEKSELNEIIKPQKAEAFVMDFYRNCLCSDKWLENYLGFDKSGNTYTFNVDMAKLVEDIYYRYKDSDYLTLEAKSDMDRYMPEIISECKANGARIRLTVTLDGGYLSKIDVALVTTGNATEISLKVFDVNKTIITDAEKNDIITKVKNAENDW